MRGQPCYFLVTGGKYSMAFFIFFYLVKNVMDMKTGTALARWMNMGTAEQAGLQGGRPLIHYLFVYFYYFIASIGCWCTCWNDGQRQPSSTVVNRTANDMMNVDMSVYVGICSTIGMVWTLIVPTAYVRLSLPTWFTLLSIPYYYFVCRPCTGRPWCLCATS